MNWYVMPFHCNACLAVLSVHLQMDTVISSSLLNHLQTPVSKTIRLMNVDYAFYHFKVKDNYSKHSMTKIKKT